MSGNVIIRPFHPADLLGFDVQAAQRSESGDPGDMAVQLLTACSTAISAACDDGRVRLVGGIVGQHWAVMLIALLSADSGPWMLGIVRALRGWLNEQAAHRMALDVRQDFEAGHRFARLLGFQAEGVMRAYGPNREDHMLYARVRADGAGGEAP